MAGYVDSRKARAALHAGAKGVPRSLGIGNARHWTRIAESLLSTTHPVVSQSRPGFPACFEAADPINGTLPIVLEGKRI